MSSAVPTSPVGWHAYQRTFVDQNRAAMARGHVDGVTAVLHARIARCAPDDVDELRNTIRSCRDYPSLLDLVANLFEADSSKGPGSDVRHGSDRPAGDGGMIGIWLNGYVPAYLDSFVSARLAGGSDTDMVAAWDEALAALPLALADRGLEVSSQESADLGECRNLPDTVAWSTEVAARLRAEQRAAQLEARRGEAVARQTAEAILMVLSARQLECTDAERERILCRTEAGELDSRLRRAVTVTAVADLFD